MITLTESSLDQYAGTVSHIARTEGQASALPEAYQPGIDFSGDSADQAQVFTQLHNASALESLRAQHAAQQAHALERRAQHLDEVCEGCGNPIPPERRRAVPEATRCVACQTSFARSRNMGAHRYVGSHV